jgi:predicted nucleotidyltransferase
MTSAVQRVLAFLADNEDQEYYDAEIFRNIDNISRAAVNKALRDLAKLGLTSRINRGKVFMNKIKAEIAEVKQYKILINAARARAYLKQVEEFISKAILFGSCAIGENNSKSDIDLFIVTQKVDLVGGKLRKHERLQLIIKKPAEMLDFPVKNKALYDQINKGLTLIDRQRDEENL